MPAAKPLEMQKKHLTYAEIEKKKENIKRSTPITKLKAPKIILDNPKYYQKWKEVLLLYKGTEIINALDVDLLTRYVIESIALDVLFIARGSFYGLQDQSDIENLIKIETKIDSKMKMLLQLSNTLYLTPRARAGSLPNNNTDKDKPIDENTDLFGD